jgi:hypothetical protein
MAQFNIIELEQVILALQSPDPLIIRLPVYNDNTAIDIVSYDLKNDETRIRYHEEKLRILIDASA